MRRIILCYCGWAMQGKNAILRAPFNAPVAQLDRVLVSEAKGRGFDSRRAHHVTNELG